MKRRHAAPGLAGFQRRSHDRRVAGRRVAGHRVAGHRLVARPVSAVAVALVMVALVATGCAHIDVARRLRVAPLEAPQAHTMVVGHGFRLRAKRDGVVVHVQAEAVSYCRHATTQRANGFRVTERRAVGPSLMMEWLMGGLITSAGAGALTYGALNPPTTRDGELASGSSTRAWLTGGAITAVGLGLLVGAVVQQASLGRVEVALGVKTLHQAGSIGACRGAPATSGRVRITLSDGYQIEAAVGADGRAALALPADVEQRMQRDGRRATVEALGDWRSQLRISL